MSIFFVMHDLNMFIFGDFADLKHRSTNFVFCIKSNPLICRYFNEFNEWFRLRSHKCIISKQLS